MDIKRLLSLEKAISDEVEIIKDSIIQEIKSTCVPNVNKIDSICFLIRLSEIQKNNVWTPEYYFNELQAAYVKERLKNVKTVTSLLEVLNDMVETGRVKIGCNIHFLNNTTISILKQYC